MGLISAVVNNLSCGANSQLGTGTKFCPQDIENPTVVVFAEKGTKFAPSDDLTLSALQELQQKGKLIVYEGNDASGRYRHDPCFRTPRPRRRRIPNRTQMAVCRKFKI